jgi:hypothetical protein
VKPPKRAPEFLVTGLPCPDCACPAWLASTATDQEFRWFGRLFTDGPDDLLLLRCSDCGGTITAPSTKVNEMNFSAPSVTGPRGIAAAALGEPKASASRRPCRPGKVVRAPTVESGLPQARGYQTLPTWNAARRGGCRRASLAGGTRILCLSTHFFVGSLNDSRRNGLDLKLELRPAGSPHGIHGDDIQLVWAADHHKAGGYPPGEFADAATVDLCWGVP